MNWTIYFIFCGSFGVHKYFFYCWKAIVFVNDWSKQKRTKGTQTATTKTTTTLKRAKIFSLLEKKEKSLQFQVKWSEFWYSVGRFFSCHCCLLCIASLILVVVELQDHNQNLWPLCQRKEKPICLFRHELITAKAWTKSSEN